MPPEFKENRKRVLEEDKSKYYNYPIRLLIVNDTFDSIELFADDDASFSYFSRLITDYNESLVVDHATPRYDFVATQNTEKQSFTFVNDLEDSLDFLLNSESISKDTYDQISYQLKHYNKSPSTTETTVLSQKCAP